VYGTNRPDSDYDFVVVVPKTEKTRAENMRIAKEAVFDLNISVDVFVYDEAYFNDWKTELNSIPEVAHSLGLEIPLG
jgi:predicted nucleotidyltransferase